jgi:hypothetical protein
MTIRPAVPDDADRITRLYLESAEHHASLDPERYFGYPRLSRYRPVTGSGGHQVRTASRSSRRLRSVPDTRITVSVHNLYEQLKTGVADTVRASHHSST